MCVLSSFPLNHHQKQMCSHNITKSKKRTLKICCQVLNTLSFNKLRLKKQETLTTEGDWWQKYELRKSQESLLCLDSVRPLAPGWLEQRWGGYSTTWPQRQSVSLGLMWGEPVSARTHFPSCGHISKCSVSMALQIYYLCWKEDGLIEKKKSEKVSPDKSDLWWTKNDLQDEELDQIQSIRDGLWGRGQPRFLCFISAWPHILILICPTTTVLF